MTFRSLFPCLCTLVVGAAVGYGVASGFFGKNPTTSLQAQAIPDKSMADASGGTSGTSAVSGTTSTVADADDSSCGSPNVTPAQALAKLKSWIAQGAPERGHFDSISMLAVYAKSDPRAALKFVNDAKRFPQRNYAYGVALSALAAVDLPATEAWVRANLKDEVQSDVTDSIICSLASQKPEAALEMALADGIKVTSYTRNYAISNLVNSSPEKAVLALHKLPAQDQDDCAVQLARTWLYTDRTAALSWCEAQCDQRYAGKIYDNILMNEADDHPENIPNLIAKFKMKPEDYNDCLWNLARNAPDIAIGILQKLPPADASSRAYTIINQMFSDNPDQALEIAKVYMSPAARAENISDAWTQWTRSDRRAADEWLANLSDPEIKKEIQSRQLLDSDPGAALAMASKDSASSTEGYSFVDRAFSRYADEHAEEALTWLMTNPQYLNRDRLMTALRSGVDAEDSHVVLDHFDSLPDDKAREMALQAVTQTWIEKGDFDLALQTIPLLRDSTQQTATQFQVYLAKSRLDKSEANEWLSKQSMTPEMRKMWTGIATGFLDDGASSDHSDYLELPAPERHL